MSKDSSLVCSYCFASDPASDEGADVGSGVGAGAGSAAVSDEPLDADPEFGSGALT
jgi:hypothetical protein